MTAARPPQDASAEAPRTIERTTVNSAADSDNKIHSDAEAQRYGYRGALVPGVTLYAYMSQVFVPYFGPGWLERGSSTVRLLRPVYEGERVICSGVPRHTPDGDVLDLTCSREDGTVCADGSAWLNGEPAANDRWQAPDLVEKAPSEPRQVLVAGQVPLGQELAPIDWLFSADNVTAYTDETADPLDWYHGTSPSGASVPPGVIAGRQARLLRHNFSFGPSIHTASAITNLAAAPVGALYRTGGIIRETFERKGNHYLVLDALTTAGDVPVARIRHTSIFQVRTAP